MDQLDEELAAEKAALAKLAARVQRVKQTRLPAGRVLDPTSQARFDREVAAGQTEPPGFLDKLRAAAGVEGGGNLGHDIARTARDVGSGLSFGLTDMLDPEGRAAERAEDPVASGIGRFSGGLLSSAVGPLAAAGKGAAGLLRMAERSVPALAKTAVGRIAGQTAVGAGLGGGASAAEAATAGGSLKDVGDSALRGAGWGALIGGGAQALPETGRAISSAVRNSVGGKARALIEKYGGKVGPLDSGSGGAFDEELKGLPANDKGIGEAAQRSAGRVLDKADELHQERVVKPYREAKDHIDRVAGDDSVDVDDVHQALMEAYQSAKLTEGQRGTLGREIDAFERKYAGPHGVRVMSEKDLNDYKTMLQALSKVGQAGEHSIPQGLLGDVAGKVKAKVDQGPYGPLNEQYHEGMTDRSELRRGLGLGPRESSNSLAEENRVRNVLMRQSQDTTTAGATTMDLEQLKQAYPELERDIDLPSLLGAKSDLQFRIGNPAHGGLIQRIKHEGMTGAAAYALSSLLGHGPLGAALTVGGSMASANAAPLAGRLFYGPARALEGLPGNFPQLPGFIPEIEQATAEGLARMRKKK